MVKRARDHQKRGPTLGAPDGWNALILAHLEPNCNEMIHLRIARGALLMSRAAWVGPTSGAPVDSNALTFVYLEPKCREMIDLRVARGALLS